MLSTLFLFIFYTIFCSALLLKIPIIQQCGLKKNSIIALFIFKLIGGLVYFYILKVRFYGGDGHGLYLSVISEQMETLATNPKEVVRYFFCGWNAFELNEPVFSTTNIIRWSDIGSQLSYRFMMLANLFSFGNEVVNVIFYNSIFFVGQIALFSTFAKLYPLRKSLFLLPIFFIPSVWFWCSGIHKDGFVLSFVGLTIYYVHQYYFTRANKYIAYTIVFLFLAICIRYYISIILLPMLGLHLLSNRKPRHSIAIFGVGIVIFLLVFFNVSRLNNKINPPNAICIKQRDFKSLPSTSYIHTSSLQPNAISFIQALPNSLNKILMRPYIWEAKDAMYFISGLETLLIFISMLVGILYINSNKLKRPLVLFCFSVSLFMFIIIGYIVPFSGAFIRYRSEYYPLLFCTFIAIGAYPFLLKLNAKLDAYIFK